MYKVKIDYRKKKVWFSLNDSDEFIFREDRELSMMINNVKARKMISKSNTGYITNLFRYIPLYRI